MAEKTTQKQEESIDQVVVSRSSSKKNKKFVLISIIVCLVIVAAIVYSSVILSVGNQECSTGSNLQLLSQASKSTSIYDLSELKSVVNKIQNIPHYQKDPNCLYPVTYYYYESGNTKEANNYLAELKKVYNPSHGFNSALGKTYSISELQYLINNQVENGKTAEKNITLITPLKVQK